MDRTIKLIFVSLGVAIILASCGGGKKDGQNKKPTPTAVSVDVAERQRAVYYDEYPATVTALSQVDLKAQVTGYVTGIFFKDGQRLHRGQKLYTIDKQQYQANYDQAIADLNVQKANLFKAQQDADRYAGLYKQDAVANQLYD